MAGGQGGGVVGVEVSGAAAAGGEVVCLGGADGGVGLEDVEEGGHGGLVGSERRGGEV